MKRIMLITGTRPEIIKMAPVYQALQKLEGCRPVWCHSGQHDSMASQMFGFFGITPDFELQRPNGASLADLAAGILKRVDELLVRSPADFVCVHGDTTTTFAAALTAFYRRVPVLHVEAGLRTHQLDQPFPEESNRRLAAVVTTRHYAPTARARENLLHEGVPDEAIRVTGNTVVDAQKWLVERHHIRRELPAQPTLLVTAHRRENWDSLAHVCQAIRALLDAVPGLRVIFPVHLNPFVKDRVHQGLGGHPGVVLCEPLDYLALQRQLACSTAVLTDSGGIQEEAAGFNVPCFVMREVTERPEAVEAGNSMLVGTEVARIVENLAPVLHGERRVPRLSANPFGDGYAAERIVEDVRAML